MKKINEPFFSIIIPTLNEEKFLPKLLDNLVKQKFKNFEVIIVDGGSFDKTIEKAREYIFFLDLKIITRKKRNVSYQRNCGAKMAKGQFLIFLDADSQVNCFFTKKVYKNILKKKGLLFLPYLEPEENKSHYKFLFEFVNFLVEASQISGRPFSAGGALIIEKNFFKTIGSYNENLFLAEDHELIKRALQWGVRAKFLKGVKVKFCLRRLKKEGNLALFYKYLLASAHYIFKGEIRQKIFDYQMGGQYFKIDNKKNSFINNFEEYLNQIKKLFTF